MLFSATGLRAVIRAADDERAHRPTPAPGSPRLRSVSSSMCPGSWGAVVWAVFVGIPAGGGVRMCGSWPLAGARRGHGHDGRCGSCPRQDTARPTPTRRPRPARRAGLPLLERATGVRRTITTKWLIVLASFPAPTPFFDAGRRVGDRRLGGRTRAPDRGQWPRAGPWTIRTDGPPGGAGAGLPPVTPLGVRGLAEPRALVVALLLCLLQHRRADLRSICAGRVGRCRPGGARSRAGVPITFVDLSRTLGPRDQARWGRSTRAASAARSCRGWSDSVPHASVRCAPG